jgi:hypothetical protein
VPGLLLIVLAGLALPFGLWWWWGYANWSNDRYIATNDRLIDLEKLPLGLRTKQAVTTFDKIQNVSFDIPNPLATILDYGTVIIRTAGAEGALTFPFLRHPSHIQAEIFHRLTAFDEAKSRREREERWQDLPDWFSTYEDLKKS